MVVAANKADLPAQDEQAGDFAMLGFPAFPVSAAHGRGIEELMAAVLPHLPPASGEPEPARLKVAVVGRFKTGKSSFVNELLGARLASEDTNPETAAITAFAMATRSRQPSSSCPNKSG